MSSEKASESFGQIQASDAEKRQAPRYACNLQPAWTEWGSGRGESWAGTVYNISTTGVCLRTKVPIKSGTVLVLKLLSESQGLSRPIPARVMHCTRSEEEDFLVGCSFVRRITEQELHLFCEEFTEDG